MARDRKILGYVLITMFAVGAVVFLQWFAQGMWLSNFCNQDAACQQEMSARVTMRGIFLVASAAGLIASIVWVRKRK